MVITAGEGAAVMGLFLEDYTPRITFTAHRITMRQIAAEICVYTNHSLVIESLASAG